MSVFRRRRRDDEQPPEADEPRPVEADTLEDADRAGGVRGDRPPGQGGSGPWDAGEVEDPAASGRVDLGGVWLPGRKGLELRVEADPATGTVVAVTLVLGGSGLQVQPFAAPRTEGIWNEVRAEIAAGITRQGGVVDEVDGPLGPELRAKVPVRQQDGTGAAEPARFLGVDGPRWFLRGVLTGRAAVEPGADEPLLDVFRDIVVVRGSAPMAPRDPIPLRLPDEPSDGGAPGEPGEEDPLSPFERGPEITEIR